MGVATMNAPARRVDPVNELGHEFGGNGGSGREAMVEVASARAAQEVQAAMVVAKKFPRDETKSFNRIMQACKRKALAEQAIYAYPRGGETVEGPSIRLAEAMAQSWGNIDFGIIELEQRGGESSIMAYAWDLETNTRQTKIFTVKHLRYTRKNGNTSLNDPRDIYEMTANQGARRLRACILGVIPGDVVDAAVSECEKTMAGNNGEPLVDRVRKMLAAFEEYGVNQPMIETRLGHRLDATTEAELARLRKIFRSLKDNMANVEDFFPSPGQQQSQKAADLNQSLKQPAPVAQTPEQEAQAELRGHDFARPGAEGQDQQDPEGVSDKAEEHADLPGQAAQQTAPAAQQTTSPAQSSGTPAMTENDKWWASLRELAEGIPENNLVNGVAHWRKVNNLMAFKEHLAKPKVQKELFEAIQKREGTYFSVPQQ